MAEVAKIEGLEAVARRLRRLPQAVRRKHALKALRAGMRPIARSARNSVPVDTGLLKRSLATRAVPLSKSRNTARLKLGVKVSRKGRRSGSDAFYWRFIEFGTKNIEAQPFLRPALENYRARAADLIKRNLLKGIEVEARKR